MFLSILECRLKLEIALKLFDSSTATNGESIASLLITQCSLRRFDKLLLIWNCWVFSSLNLPVALNIVSLKTKVWGKTGSKIYGPKAGLDYEDNQLRFSLLCQAALEAPRILNLNNNKYFSGPYGMDPPKNLESWIFFFFFFLEEAISLGYIFCCTLRQGKMFFLLAMIGTLLCFHATWNSCTNQREFTRMQR